MHAKSKEETLKHVVVAKKKFQRKVLMNGIGLISSKKNVFAKIASKQEQLNHVVGVNKNIQRKTFLNISGDRLTMSAAAISQAAAGQ